MTLPPMILFSLFQILVSFAQIITLHIWYGLMKYWCRAITEAELGLTGDPRWAKIPLSSAKLWSDSMPLWQWLPAIKHDGYLETMTVMNWWAESHKIFIRDYRLKGNGDWLFFSSSFFFCLSPESSMRSNRATFLPDKEHVVFIFVFQRTSHGWCCSRQKAFFWLKCAV